MIRTIARTARIRRRCAGCTDGTGFIRPGERYLDGRIAPWTDLVNETPHWQRMAECRRCAARYGRAHRLVTLPCQPSTPEAVDH